MPAAAVIPAPIAYIKVVAVKKLVVGFLVWCAWPMAARLRECRCAPVILLDNGCALHWSWSIDRLASFTLKKLECLKQALL